MKHLLPQTALPEAGTPATYGIGSDSYAYVVTRTAGKTVVYAARAEKIESGDSYVLVPIRDEQKFTLRDSGNFKPVGSNSGFLSFGKARDYFDPSF